MGAKFLQTTHMTPSYPTTAYSGYGYPQQYAQTTTTTTTTGYGTAVPQTAATGAYNAAYSSYAANYATTGTYNTAAYASSYPGYAAAAAAYPSYDTIASAPAIEEEADDGDVESTALPVWRNEKTMNMPNILHSNIVTAPYFKKLTEIRTYYEVLTEIREKVTYLAPFMRNNGNAASSAFCLLYKLFT